MIRQSIQRLAPVFFFIFTIDKFLIDPLLLKRRKISLPRTYVWVCTESPDEETESSLFLPHPAILVNGKSDEKQRLEGARRGEKRPTSQYRCHQKTSQRKWIRFPWRSNSATGTTSFAAKLEGPQRAKVLLVGVLLLPLRNI